MHYLGYELPERPGFGGLLLEVEPQPTAHGGATRDDIHFVAKSEGPNSRETRESIEAFRDATLVIDLTDHSGQ